MPKIRGGRKRGDDVTVKMVTCEKCKSVTTRRQSVPVKRKLYCKKCGEIILAKIIADNDAAEKAIVEAERERECARLKGLPTFRARCKRRERLFTDGAKNEFEVVGN